MTMFDFSLNEESSDLVDWFLPVSFNSKRHAECIEGTIADSQTWRVKERMKTVSVALVLCLNVGVDPPDIVKTQPCARLECWIDPLSLVPQKALDSIAAALQKQYEKWQPRARYKHSLDPTVDEVKRLCTSLRRSAKDDRLLFHYNGHGVPKPTANGEIWVFNKTYTQYIPLSIYDLQQWMGAPSIYVYDCSCAGLVVESFKQFATQHEREFELLVNNSKTPYDGPPLPSYGSCIQLAACGATQILPMNPDLPADLFTACLTTPVTMALKWFVLQNNKKLLPDITMDLIDKIPGQINDRRTMLGELNWIFTAITDTIAWNVLPKDTFQHLFRQDLLVASLFRNFLLAERIMRYYNCTPVSSPTLPSTYHHPMWQAWDLAVDLCLVQLPAVLKDNAAYSYSPFFSEQLTAFQVWLSLSHNPSSIPEQLPIILQVLLSQVHRLRALELLGRFLDLGPWAVNLALSVGIFPYVLKLLQSSARELRPLLVFIWAKVLAVDNTCQNDLVRDGGFKYFLTVLSESYMPAEHRTMAAFCISCIVNNFPNGQSSALQGNVVAICLEQLPDPCPKLRQWVAICLGRIWNNFEQARWCGVRDSAHEKLEILLSDPEPEVRAAAVYALGAFLNSTTERTDHANAIDQSIGMMLINKVANDGSPIVRKEVVVALQWFLILFENQFVAVGHQYMEEEKAKESTVNHLLPPEIPSGMLMGSGMRKVASRDRLKAVLSGSPVSNALDISYQADGTSLNLERIRRVSSSTSISSMSSGIHNPYSLTSSLGYASVFGNIWKTLVALSNDPYPEIAKLAEHLVNYIKQKVNELHRPDTGKGGKIPSMSEPSSPSGRPSFLTGDSPPTHQNGIIPHSTQDSNRKSGNRWTESSAPYQHYQYFAQFNRIRKTFDRGPEIRELGEETDDILEPRNPLVETCYIAWCSKYFSEPVLKPGESDIDSPTHLEKEWLYLRNESIRKEVIAEQKRLECGKFDEQIFINKNRSVPASIKFHPYESHMVVTDKDYFSVWDWEKGYLLHSHNSHAHQNVRITALDFVNAHDGTLLLVGSDDGAVKIWKNYISETDLQLVTAFQIIQDLLPSTRGAGLVLHWEQHSSQLLASGDVRHIRIWDAEKESKVQDIPTGADSCLTCLSSNAELTGLITAGCGDGTVRVYDRRMPQNECCLHVFHEHSGWVVNASLLHKENTAQIISGSVAGDVKFWDVRHTNSIKSIPPTNAMTAMAIHSSLDLIACGAASQFISVFNENGDNVSTIKYHDGFMGHRIGPISCLAFHPYKASLAAGSIDSLISVYSVNRKH